MVKIEWIYTGDQEDKFIELDCTEAELAEARRVLNPNWEKDGWVTGEFAAWVAEVASGVPHAEAMEWAKS